MLKKDCQCNSYNLSDINIFGLFLTFIFISGLIMQKTSFLVSSIDITSITISFSGKYINIT